MDNPSEKNVPIETQSFIIALPDNWSIQGPREGPLKIVGPAGEVVIISSARIIQDKQDGDPAKLKMVREQLGENLKEAIRQGAVYGEIIKIEESEIEGGWPFYSTTQFSEDGKEQLSFFGILGPKIGILVTCERKVTNSETLSILEKALKSISWKDIS